MAIKKKAANGAGSIRKRADGRWEGQYVAGYDGGTGKTIPRSVYGKTQKEVRQKLTEVTRSLDTGTYQAPNRITVGDWLDKWADTYCYALKPRTIGTYKAQIKSRIKPYIGSICLSKLSNVRVQSYYKDLIQGDKNHAPLSPKSVQNIHGIRQSELLGLEWADINFELGEITVQRQLQRDYGGKNTLL